MGCLLEDRVAWCWRVALVLSSCLMAPCLMALLRGPVLSWPSPRALYRGSAPWSCCMALYYGSAPWSCTVALHCGPALCSVHLALVGARALGLFAADVPSLLCVFWDPWHMLR